MSFDDYLVTPVSTTDLHRAIDATRRRATYDAPLQEYDTVVSKRDVLATETPREELDPDYAELTSRIEAIESRLENMVAAFDDRDIVTAMRMAR